jgi:hypothetical protein
LLPISVTYTWNGHFLANTKELQYEVVALAAFALSQRCFLDAEARMDTAMLWTSESDPRASIQASFGYGSALNPVKKNNYKPKHVKISGSSWFIN